MMKNLYVVQPYRVGAVTGKSLAMIIPSEVAKEYKIDEFTILILCVDAKKEKIIMQAIVRTEIFDKKEKMIPADKSFEASNQQVSSGSQ
jgi:antitoxin component of MazEF toxin-antitoxin module